MPTEARVSRERISLKYKIIVAIALTMSAAFSFWNLGANRLWEDEAQTALIGENILSTGLPTASNGTNLVTIFADHRDVRDGIYIWQGWFPSYLAAGSMAVFGRSATGARLPFAIAFVVFIGFYYNFLRRRDDRSGHIWLTLFLTITCVPLLLHSRQCRYYALLPLLSLLVVDSYLSVLTKPNSKHLAMIVVWGTIFLNSFFPGAFLLGVALTIDLIRRRPAGDVLKKLATTGAIILVLNLPIAWFCRIWDRRFGTESFFNDRAAWGMYLVRYLLTLNNYFFPFSVIIAACALKWKSFDRQKFLANELNFLFFVICATHLVGFAVLSDYPFSRYILGITPFLMFFASSCIETISFNKPWLIWPVAAVVTMTNVLNCLPLPLLRHTKLQDAQWTTAGIDLHFIDPKNVRFSYARGEVKALINQALEFPFLNYLRSLVHPPNGPIDLIVDYLQKNAAPTDRVKISYGDLPLMFHTDLTITGSTETGQPGPEWIISRHFRPLRTDDQFFRENSGYHYTKITIPFPDLQWNNQPDPLYHYYDPPAPDPAPPIVVLRKQ